MKKIGKIGKRNILANKKLKQEYLRRGITTCEAKLNGCMRDFGLSFHHRHKRHWYRDKPELLSDFNQTILVCANCHHLLETDRKLTEEIFNKLRQPE